MSCDLHVSFGLIKIVEIETGWKKIFTDLTKLLMFQVTFSLNKSISFICYNTYYTGIGIVLY